MDLRWDWKELNKLLLAGCILLLRKNTTSKNIYSWGIDDRGDRVVSLP